MELSTYLKGNRYPGRLLLAGATMENKPVLLYAITGRSKNSRNRILKKEDGMLKTMPYDLSMVSDPSLIIYHAMRLTKGAIVLTNGDQTDTIVETLEQGGSLSDALEKRDYEPDEPSYTARISAVLAPDHSYSLSIIRKQGNETNRAIWNYPGEPGVGYIIHTYEGDGDPLPTFVGEPRRFILPGSLDELCSLVWDSLDFDNKIALYANVGGDEKIINKREE